MTKEEKSVRSDISSVRIRDESRSAANLKVIKECFEKKEKRNSDLHS